jgi:hypothetical protein
MSGVRQSGIRIGQEITGCRGDALWAYPSLLISRRAASSIGRLSTSNRIFRHHGALSSAFRFRAVARDANRPRCPEAGLLRLGAVHQGRSRAHCVPTQLPNHLPR